MHKVVNASTIGCAALFLTAVFANGQSTFDLTKVSPYVNTPSVTATGTLLLHNTNDRPVGSQAYVIGVGATAMPSYSVGDTLQWAILARSTTPNPATLNLGVQNGSGDENSLSIRNQLVIPTGGATWVVSTSRVVNVVKGTVYFYIPSPIGQEVEVRDLILGTPDQVNAYIAAHPAGNRLVNPGFETPDASVPLGSALTTTHYSGTAAANWLFADNGDNTVAHTTELVAGTLSGGGDRMIHVKTSGPSDGLYQYFLPVSDTGINNATVSAWVYAVSGQVTLYSGRAGGVSGGAQTTTSTGHWQHLQYSTGSNYITGVFIYSSTPAGSEYYVDNVSVTANRAPVAAAGPNQSVNELDQVTLDGSGSSDPDQDPLTYSWAQILGTPAVTLSGANTAHPGFTAPDLAAHSDGVTLTFRLTVSDGTLTSSGDVNVRVSSVNHPPLADAGADQAVPERTIVTLHGENSADTDGDALSYTWKQVGGPAVTLSDPSSATPTFAAPTVGVSGAALTFQLTVDDGYGGSASDTVVINVTYANRPPTADAGGDQTVAEGVLASLAGSGDDPDSNALSYSWSQVSGPAVVLLGADSQTPSFVAPQVSRDEADVLLRLTVSDPFGGVATDDVNVHIANVNHPPTADAPVNFTVAEGTATRLLGTGSDADSEEVSQLIYAWQQIAGPSVTLAGSGADVNFTAPLITAGGDPNAKATLTFRLTVTDPNGASATDDVDVVVTNVDHSPVADAGGNYGVNEAATVVLNGANSSDPDGDTLSYAWTQIAGPAVQLSNAATASPSFVAPFVNAAGATLKFQLTVNDAFGGTCNDVATVTVANINDPPTIAAAQPSVAVLWPPDHRMVPISINRVFDPNNNATIQITGVTQDEPTNGLGDGDTPVDAVINGDGTVLLRAERSGSGDGRVYNVYFTASDFEGRASGVVKITVPKGKKNDAAIDSGSSFDSTR